MVILFILIFKINKISNILYYLMTDNNLMLNIKY